MENSDKKTCGGMCGGSCGSGTCGMESHGGCCSHHGGRRHLVGVILKIVVIILIFWCGFKLGFLTGVLKAAGGQVRYGSSYGMMNGNIYGGRSPITTPPTQ